MVNRIFIIHGWEGQPHQHWTPWLKKELLDKNFEIYEPEMPDTMKPKISAWVSHLKKVVGKVDKNTYFVGHSIGCQTIMRFLEKENYSGKANAIFVAGWFQLDNLETPEVEKIAVPWVKEDIDFKKLKSKLNLTVILSSNEPYGQVKENAQKFKDYLGAKVIIEKNKGHFTEEDGVTELPSLLKELKVMAK